MLRSDACTSWKFYKGLDSINVMPKILNLQKENHGNLFLLGLTPIGIRTIALDPTCKSFTLLELVSH